MSEKDAPQNSPKEFLTFCGVLGLGRLVIEGKENAVELLRRAASDERWRIREAVKKALQIIGKHDLGQLFIIGKDWINGNMYEQRAILTSICREEFLRDPSYARETFHLLEKAMNSIAGAKASTREYKLLKKALGYYWSSAILACPEQGKPMFEHWLLSNDPNIRWILKKALKDKQLIKKESHWVARCRHKIINVQDELLK
ncbi:hypothetical protein ACG2F4_07320 [Halalkalibaculum sp. DA3122]|uniref:hypothetical protein n=1 Tax=Halalkalibaculum sp. DA3122 TaxID=3373607 RepID=UPI003753F4FB